MAPTHAIKELVCPGVGSLGSGDGDAATQIPEEDAIKHMFVPADHVSAVLISPHRILCTGGVENVGRVLPLTVLRYLDLANSITGEHAWADPIPLRQESQSQPSQRRGRARKDRDPAFPVPREAHTLTLAPDGSLYLVGGLKLGGSEHGSPCKSIFALKLADETWSRVVEPTPAKPKSKAARENAVGPRFAHSALHYNGLPNATARSRGVAKGVLLVYGGYSSTDDKSPAGTVHAFNIKMNRWEIVAVKKGKAPTLAYHAAVLLEDHYMVVHGGNNGQHNDCMDMSDETHVFDVKSKAWVHPKLHVDSCEPPQPRRKHSAVNGIGPQKGCVVFFGGERENGEFSDSFHSLRLVHEEDGISVLWKKLPTNTSAMRTQPSNAAGIGAMVACPDLSQYIFVGGRGPGGPRKYPFAIAARAVEQDMSLTPLSSAVPDSDSFRLCRSRSATAGPSVKPLAKPSIEVEEKFDEVAAASGRKARLNRSNKSSAANAKPPVESSVIIDDCDEITAVGSTAGRKSRLNRSTTSKRNKKPILSESESPSLADDIAVLQKSHKKTKSGIKRPRMATPMGTPVKPEAPGTAEKAAPAVPRVAWNASLEKNGMSGKTDAEMKDLSPSPANITSSRAAKATNAEGPSTPLRLKVKPGAPSRVEPTSPPVPKKMRSEDSDDAVVIMDSDPIDLDLDLSADKDSDVKEVPVAAPAPAPEPAPAAEAADESDDGENVSGFLTSQALADKGRARKRAEIQARTRGRARARGASSRGRGRGRSRTALQTQLDEAEQTEKLEARVAELESEMEQSDIANRMLHTENRDLNKEVAELIKEVELFRMLRDRADKEADSGAHSSRGQRSTKELAADRANSVIDTHKDREIARLTSKVEEFEGELKGKSDDNRQLLLLLNETQNREKSSMNQVAEQKEVIELQKGRIHKFEIELKVRTEMTEETANLCAGKDLQIGQLNALVLDKDRKIQDLKQAQSAAGSRVEDGIAKLSSTKRAASSLQEELSEAKAKVSRLEHAEEAWKRKRRNLERQVEEVEQVATSRKSEKDYLEEKNIELRAKLKASEEEYNGKVEELERMTVEMKKAMEQSAKDRAQAAASMAEQSRTRTAGEKAKLEAEHLRLKNEDEKKRMQGAVAGLLRSMQGFTATMNGMDIVSSEQVNSLNADVQKYAAGAGAGGGEETPSRSKGKHDFLFMSNSGVNVENAKQDGQAKPVAMDVDWPKAVVGAEVETPVKTPKSKRGNSDVLVSSSGTENAEVDVTPVKKRNGVQKGGRTAAVGTEVETPVKTPRSSKRGDEVLVSSSGTENAEADVTPVKKRNGMMQKGGLAAAVGAEAETPVKTPRSSKRGDVLVSSSEVDATPVKKRNGARRVGGRSGILVSSSGTESKRNTSRKGGTSDILVSSSGTEKEVSPQGGEAKGNGAPGADVLVSSSGTENAAGEDDDPEP